MSWQSQIHSYDKRRNLALPGDRGSTLAFCVEQWIGLAQESIEKRGAFYVALSGGSTPKVIYQALANNSERVDWNNVYLFWSDERCVPPDNAESNYKMAMDSGFDRVPIPEKNIFRMKGELPPEKAARDYDAIIQKNIPQQEFDLVMLGMGDDGHTASLFPETEGLSPTKHNAIANFIPQKDVWRLTLTFECINKARNIVIYVLGKEKSTMLKQALSETNKELLVPSQRLGTTSHKALWIVDDEANHMHKMPRKESV